MDSVKNRKLFPELVDAPSEVKKAKFHLPSSFWAAIQTDPALKAEWDQRVDARAREILESEAAPQKQAILEEARKQGIAQGLEEGKQRAQEICDRLEAIATGVVKEKEALLHSHERVWCQTLSRTAQRFLAPLSPERLSSLQGWLEEGIGELAKSGKIRVLVSPSVLAQLGELATGSMPHWEWAADPNVKDGDLRVELEGGGLLFSSQDQSEKIDAKLKEILGV